MGKVGSLKLVGPGGGNDPGVWARWLGGAVCRPLRWGQAEEVGEDCGQVNLGLPPAAGPLEGGGWSRKGGAK